MLLSFSAVALAAETLTGHPGGSGEGSSVPGTDDLLDSYAYNQSEQMSSIAASFGDYATIDDLRYGTVVDVSISLFTCWGVITGAIPTSLELMGVEDGSGAPSGAPVLTLAAPGLFCGNTGYTFAGYSVWVAELDFWSNRVDVSTPCWLGSYRSDGTNWYPLGGITVTGS